MANLDSLEAFTRSIRRAANFKSLQPIIPTRLLDDEEQQQQQITPTHSHRRHEEVPAEQQTDEAAAERDDSQFPGQLRDLRDPNNQAGQNEESPLLDQNNRTSQIISSATAESGFVPLQIKLNDPARKRVHSNVLIGIGMLSLPLGIRYSGWAIGLLFLLTTAGWRALPLSFGLIMAVWGGHRDMRHPQKYEHGLKLIFGFVTSVDLVMAIVGYLMYGRRTKDEISTNVLTTQEYPGALHVVVLILVAIMPLTKFLLNCAPIISTLEVLSCIDPRAATVKPNRFNHSTFLTKPLRAVFRIGVTCTIVSLAILVPSFEVISAIMGAAFCSLICVILPATFHLKMFGGEISRREALFNWALILSSAALGIAGTVWGFLPKEWMGLEEVH
ncbi:hypothetical protein D0865_11574 [Hortaea werneckii]|uniref:Amino acid transporter transmembrane domain-containing protein n=1 Tax=Hortaea werneckii TaxID=91943 RepID=A0A3M7BTG2_HORWE|nr:hypothetical protein D0865_11574 [Hortaea werneckii]